MNSIVIRPDKVDTYRLNNIGAGPFTLLAMIPGLAGQFITKIRFSADTSGVTQATQISLDDAGAMLANRVVMLEDPTTSGANTRLDFETEFTDPARIWLKGGVAPGSSITVFVYRKVI